MAAPPAGRVARVATFCVFGLFLTLGISVQWLDPVFGIWFSEIFIFFGAAWVVLRASGREPLQSTAFTPFRGRAAAFGFAVGTLNLFAAVLPIQAVALTLAPAGASEAFDSSRIFEGRSAWGLAAIVVSVSFAAPVCEEFFFRGVLQKQWSATGARPWTAVLGTSALFSALHLDPIGFPARLELGLLFGWLFLRTGSLWPGIFAHAANNGVSTLLYFLGRKLGAEKAEPDVGAALAMAVVGLLPLVALVRRGLLKGWVTAQGDAVPADRLGRPLGPYAAARPWILAQTLSLGLFLATKRWLVPLLQR
ncbi:MAG TPA: type II CAAX endopeptidase family protein [Myxococcaceae bacterium]|nr:type II CAAX endopeptidase family protein [Myxococcaceae bacterium]